MENLNIKALTATLQEFDQMAEQSAQNFNNTFTTQLEELSNSFKETSTKFSSIFDGVKQSITAKLEGVTAISDEAAAMIKESHLASAEKIKEAMHEMQELGSYEFKLLSDNAATSFLEKNEHIFAGLEELKEKMCETTELWKEKFAYLFENVSCSFAETNYGMFEGLEELKEKAYEASESYKEKFAHLFENVSYSFTKTNYGMFEGLDALREKAAEISYGMQYSMTSAFAGTKESFESSLAYMKEISETKFGDITDIGKAAAEEIQNRFGEMFSNINERMCETQNAITTSCGIIKNIFCGTSISIETDFSEALSGIEESLAEFLNKAEDCTCKVRGFFRGVNTVIDESFTVLSRVNSALSVYNGLAKAMPAIKAAKLGITNALAAAKGKKGLTSKVAALGITKMKVAKTMGLAAIPIAAGLAVASSAMSRFATGGFPAQGQMFIAREAGPELVGQIGGRTAVVNNNQIVESVSAGVYSANMEQNDLLREQNRLLNALLQKGTSVSVDGKEILRVVERTQRERGLPIMAGGVL